MYEKKLEELNMEQMLIQGQINNVALLLEKTRGSP
jgi:hypothetical protein